MFTKNILFEPVAVHSLQGFNIACHISCREEKTHGITPFLTTSRRETRTMLNVPEITFMRNVTFAWFPVLQHWYF